MSNISIIGLSPERHNIKYSIVPMPNMVDVCSALAEELVKMHAETPKTVLFCQTLQQCGNFYAKIKHLLGKNITVPPGAPSILPFRMVSLFTSAFRMELHNEIIQEFCKQ